MNLLEESAMTASVTPGRALRYAGGSAHGLLHHGLGHYHNAAIGAAGIKNYAEDLQSTGHAAAGDHQVRPPDVRWRLELGGGWIH